MPTPTLAGTPGACQQVVLNPSFETNTAWTIANAPIRARYATEKAYGGVQSMHMGVHPGEESALGDSSVWQAVTLPADARSAVLSFSYWPGHEDGSDEDWQAAWVFDATMKAPPLRAVLRMRSDAQTWLYHAHDLTALRGRTITLLFTVFNDGVGNDRTWWYVDDVFLTVCGSSQLATTPAQPQQAPDVVSLLR
jgi:hypothetical protein